MITYFLFFLLSAWKAITKPTYRWGRNTSIFLWVVLTITIGFRYRVGGDWEGYERFYDKNSVIPLIESIKGREPLFSLLNWISYQLDFGVYGVNFVCGLIFSAGLIYFCRRTKRPWVALTVAIPYLITVVAMGYTRQGTAIGLLLFGYSNLADRKVIQFILWVIAASLFQLTSVVVLPFAIPYLRSKSLANTIIKFVLAFIGITGISYIFLSGRIEILIAGYFKSGMESEGAYVRVFLNVVPSILYLIYENRLEINKYTKILWRWMSYFALLCLIGLFVVPSTTSIDRLALFGIPIQLFVASTIPDYRIFSLRPKVLISLVVIFALLVLAVWLGFASNAFAWIPYRNIIWSSMNPL